MLIKMTDFVKYIISQKLNICVKEEILIIKYNSHFQTKIKNVNWN